MEGLPYIDEYSAEIGATPEQVWSALVAVLRTGLGGNTPVALTRLLSLEPSGWKGEWRGTPEPDDTMPGFAVAETRPPERLALRGQHRFSRYALVFELDEHSSGVCTIRAQTWAEFPGLTGHVYRALVIGTRGHRVVVRYLLRNIARSLPA